MRYTDKISFEERQKGSEELLTKYKTRKPIIIYDDHTKITYKFLLSDDHAISFLLINLKKRMKVNKFDSIFLFINKNTIPCPTDNILSLYKKFKDEDGYLYIDVKRENTFG
jgi:hypothetical protein